MKAARGITGALVATTLASGLIGVVGPPAGAVALAAARPFPSPGTPPGGIPTTPPPGDSISRRIDIPKDYMQWQEYRCPLGKAMTNFSLTAGPNIHLGTQTAFPADRYHGSGFGRDVINMSHTDSTWYDVSYTCSSAPPPPDDIKILTGTHYIDPSTTETTFQLDCPSNHPVFVKSELKGWVSGVTDADPAAVFASQFRTFVEAIMRQGVQVGAVVHVVDNMMGEDKGYSSISGTYTCRNESPTA